MSYLGLDLGGTNIKGLLLSDDGTVLADESVATPRTGVADVIAAMAELGRRLANGRPTSIGVAVPGVIDPGAGTVEFLPNVPGDWENRPAARELGTALGAPAWLLNDVRAATYGELHFGAGRGCRDFVMIAVGTGIGGGIVAGGQLFPGADGLAGEVGHMAIDVDGGKCSCGGWGCAETLASGWAIRAEGRALVERGGSQALLDAAKGDPNRISPALIAAVAHTGDSGAKEIMDRVARRLGVLVSNLVVLLNPERVVIGGGLAMAGAPLFAGIEATMNQRVGWFLKHTRVKVVPAEIGEEAGALGAAAWARDKAALV